MKSITRITVLAVALAGLLAGTTGALAQEAPAQGQGGQRQRQGPGNFDPAQMQQRMMERYREQLEIKDDAEGKAIEGLITKVNEARREVGFGGGGRGMFGPQQRNRQQGDNAAQGQGQGQNRRGFGPTPSPEAEALQKAIDSKAGAAELKTAMAKFRESRKANEAKLAKAQEELRAVLSVRQEAIALSLGLLN
jgi:hypothetical protein